MYQSAEKRCIPIKPPIPLPERKLLPLLGTRSQDLIAIDIAHPTDSTYFKDNAHSIRLEREYAGMGNIYSELKPTSRTDVGRNLIGKRLDICKRYDLIDGGVS